MKYIEDSKEIKDSLNDGRIIVSIDFIKPIISFLVREIIANPPSEFFSYLFFVLFFYFLILFIF